jgi:excisionase family DNA binding protein
MGFDASAAREPLFTEREAAEMLRISHSYLRLLRDQKRINCYRFGGRILYSEKHIADFKRQSEQSVLAASAA